MRSKGRAFGSRKPRFGRRAALTTALAVAAALGVASLAGAFGTFKPKVDYPVSDPGGLAVADFNGDGRRDLAATDQLNEQVAILLGKKNGKFGAPKGYPVGAGTDPFDVAAGDFNRDGRPDVAVTEYQADKVGIMLGRKGGKLSAPTSYSTTGNPYGVTVGDVNGDGRPDVITGTDSALTISLRIAKKGGKLGSEQVYASGEDPFYGVSRDFDRDGYADVAFASYTGEQVDVRFGRKNGTLSAMTPIPTGLGTGPYPVAAADFNGDHRPDIATGNYGDGSVSVILAKKNRNFGPAKNFPVTTPSEIYAIAAADFNLDKRPDLVVGNGGNATAYVLRGKKGVEFAPPVPYPIGDSVYEIVTGRFNSDKAPDFASANNGSDTVSVLLNK